MMSEDMEGCKPLGHTGCCIYRRNAVWIITMQLDIRMQ